MTNPPATSAARSLAARIEAFSDGLGRATSWIALAIVVLMATNVLLRYAFGIGSVWSQELEWHLLAPLILFGMTYAERHREHVRVDILYARYPPGARLAVDLVADALGIALSVLVVVLSWHYVVQAWEIGEGSADPGGLPMRFALKALIPIGFACFLMQCAAQAVARVHAHRAAPHRGSPHRA